MTETFPWVKKDTLEVIIRTSQETIEGSIYKYDKMRLLDMLNKSTDNFLAVSDAKVFNVESGKLLFTTAFMMVNKNYIVHMIDATDGRSLP